jgi:hypothetical protein
MLSARDATMTSLFNGPLCAPGTLGGVGPPTRRRDEVYLSPASESIESPEFEVIATVAIVAAFDLKPGQRVRVEMVTGYRETTLFAPVVHDGVPLALDPSNTQLAVAWLGRYRLVAEGVAPGIDMPTVIVLRRNGVTQALT